jgi:hypothetical protein
MKFIPNAVTLRICRTVLIGQKHSPAILFGAGVVGVVASTVLACRASLNLDMTIQQTQDKLEQAKSFHEQGHANYTDKEYRPDVARIYAKGVVSLGKLYGPAIVLGVVSIGALAGSHNILTKRNAALTAAYAALDKGFKQYRSRVIDEYGEDKDREFRYGAEEREILDHSTGELVKTGIKQVAPGDPSIYARFFDEYSKNWERTPEHNFFFVKCQQTYANDRLRARGHVFLNEVYESLGLDHTTAGAIVGWVMSGNGDNYIDFGIFDGDNPRARDFVNGREGSILLDFNVDGVIYDKI